MAVRIVSLTAKLGLDGTQFQQGLQKARQQMQSFGSGFGGGLAGGAIAQAIRKIVGEVGRIKDLSEQFGVTTDEVQKLDAAAKMSGQTFEDVGTKLERLGSARKAAGEGSEDARRNFERFGITLGDINNPAMRDIDLMQKMAAAIKGMNLTAADSQALREMFGRGGSKIATVFADLDGVKFQPISPEAIRSIDDAAKKLERLKMELTAIGATALGQATGGSGWMAAIKAFMSPGLTIGKIAGQRLDEMVNPATANNPRARSAEMVGVNQSDIDEKLWIDKEKEKEAARIKKQIAEQEQKIAEKVRDIQFQIAGAAEKRAMLEREINEHLAKGERLKALEALEKLNGLPADKKSDLLGGLNVGGIGSKGAFTGLGLERAFALAGGSNEAKQTAENTKRTAAVLNEINNKLTTPQAVDDLTF